MDNKKNNATCKICGKGYYSCLSCNDQKRLYPWKMYTDTSEHYKVFQVIHGYSIGLYDKKEAKGKLDNVDLSDLDSFKDNIKNIVKEILKEENQPQENTLSGTFVKETNVSENNHFNNKKNSKKFINNVNKNITNDTKDFTEGDAD